ncbi:hypothetical protein [Falsiroseomonas sp. E2-1-a20]|uniref:hypothetical protein n=1 Tax=Falsiroseomonas sp. E2-1-a20 TaxID=3239300 RepID=UPI003F38A3B7
MAHRLAFKAYAKLRCETAEVSSAIGRRLAIIGFVLLSACGTPDYTPVRDWAGTASQAADYPPIAAACLSRDDGALNPSHWQSDGTRAMQDGLSIYLSALGTVASDGVLPYREDPFIQIAERARLASEAGGQAVTTLGGLLRRATRRNSQAPQLGETIVETDESVQALITALRTAVGDAVAGGTEERQMVSAAYRRLELEAQDVASRRALRDVGVMRDRELAAAAEARANYDLVLKRIAEGHALLKLRAARLSQEETARQMRAAEDQLRRSAALLPRAMASTPAGIACVGPQSVPGMALPPSAFLNDARQL